MSTLPQRRHFSPRPSFCPNTLAADVDLADVETALFLAEASAKQFFGKDREGDRRIEGHFMLGRGTLDPSLNPTLVLVI